jgi:hypothetical protein
VIPAMVASSNRHGDRPIPDWGDVGVVHRAADPYGPYQHISDDSSTYTQAACNDGGHPHSKQASRLEHVGDPLSVYYRWP